MLFLSNYNWLSHVGHWSMPVAVNVDASRTTRELGTEWVILDSD
jgi:hypothetical protein